AIARYIIQCIFFADIFGGLADNNAQLNFPVGLFRTAWNDQIIIRANNGRSCLHENNGLWRNCHARFGGVVSIVEADADEFACARDAWTKARIAFNLWQRIDINFAELGQCFGSESRARKIAYMSRQIADIAFGIQYTRLFLTNFTITKKLHNLLLLAKGLAV